MTRDPVTWSAAPSRALHGEEGVYRREHGLVRLGLVDEVKLRHEVGYRLTPRGRELARVLMRERRLRDWA